MKQIAPILLVAALAALPVSAQDATDPTPDVTPDSGQMSEGMNLLQEGTRMLLEGLMQELGASP